MVLRKKKRKADDLEREDVGNIQEEGENCQLHVMLVYLHLDYKI